MNQQEQMDQVQEFVERYLELEFQARLLSDVPGKMEEFNALLRQLNDLSPNGDSNTFTGMIFRRVDGESSIVERYKLKLEQLEKFKEHLEKLMLKRRRFYKISYYDVGSGGYLCYVSPWSRFVLPSGEESHCIESCLVLRMTSVGPEILEVHSPTVFGKKKWDYQTSPGVRFDSHVYLNQAPFSTHSPSAFRVLQEQECDENSVFEREVFAKR